MEIWGVTSAFKSLIVAVAKTLFPHFFLSQSLDLAKPLQIFCDSPKQFIVSFFLCHLRRIESR